MRYRVGETEDIFASRLVRNIEESFYVNIGPQRIYTSDLAHVNYAEPEEAANLNSDERDFYHGGLVQNPEQDGSVEEYLLDLYRHVGSWFGADANGLRWPDARLEEAGKENQMEHMLNTLVKAGYMKEQEIDGDTVYFPEAKLAEEHCREHKFKGL